MKCAFCGREIGKGTGTIYSTKEGSVLGFCSSKCEKNLIKLKRKPQRVKWTTKAQKEKIIRLKGKEEKKKEKKVRVIKKTTTKKERRELRHKKKEEVKKTRKAKKK